MKKKTGESALKVNQGIEQPPSINPGLSAKKQFRPKTDLTASDYFERIRKGDRAVLSRAITLIESQLPANQQLAQEIIAMCMPHAGNSLRIGITGVPGVGKSSLIEAIGGRLTSKKHRLAVLAIDPSSQKSGGSILGDKTRMETLANDPNAFIRPSPSAGTLGGVARKTREIMVLCEAAGFDIIFIETVGVGQSETAVHSMVDFFLLLMLAGAGDELQGIKRGIMEMADMIAITKADGQNISASERAAMEYKNALHLFPPDPSGWTPRVMTLSSQNQTGLDQLWNSINDFVTVVKGNGWFGENRSAQLKNWMNETIRDHLVSDFFNKPGMKELYGVTEDQVSRGEISPYAAARKLLDQR